MVGTSNKSDPGMAIRVNHLRQPAFGYGMGDVITADQCVGDQGLVVLVSSTAVAFLG